jgi:small subunit ribosomal protein S19
MAKKEIGYKGKNIDELKIMDIIDFMKIAPTRVRRSLKRGFSDAQKRLLLRIKKSKDGKTKKPIKTHCRDMVVIPAMLDMTINIYNGKEFVPVLITCEMLGKYLGEFALTRKKVSHSAPGIGATKSSSAMSVK